VVTVDAAPTTYGLDLRASVLRLPIVGPVADFRAGASLVPTKAMLSPGTMADPHTATRIPD
jgi:hypothetical protein